MSFATQIDKLLIVEGGYSDDKNDYGGETNWGITEGVARAYGYTGDMHDLPRDTAIAIYQKDYWLGAGCDLIEPIMSQLADDLFECGVNMGTSTAGSMLQRALNTMLVNKLRLDGQVGPHTAASLAAIKAAHGDDGMSVIRGMFLSLVSYKYITLCETDPAQTEFIYGWELNRVIGAP